MGALTVPNSGLVYLDANAFIYTVEKIDPYAALLTPVWRAAQSGSIQIVTSEITWLETLVKPFRDGDVRVEGLFRSALESDEVETVAITQALWEGAAHMRVLGLKTPDALHAATAHAAQAAFFVTNDAIFRRVPGLNVAVLHEHIP